MIVVGILGAPGQDDDVAVEVARRAAALGSRVEMLGVVPGDVPGDLRLVQLAHAGIGHATVTRTNADGIEPADLELALRYLPEIRAIVLVRPDASLLPAARAAAAWTSAGLVVIGPLAIEGAAPFDDDAAAFVLDPPESDPDGTFAGFVAALAIRLDAGQPPSAAWSSTVAALAVDAVPQG